VGRGGALPGWAWRVRACDVMALPRKGPDIFAMMPGHACRTSSREHGDNRLTARHARHRVWGRLQGVEWLPWAKLQAAVLAPDGAAAAPLSLFWLGCRSALHALHALHRPHLPAKSEPENPRPPCHDPPARARRSERTTARSFLFYPRLSSITQRLCHATLLSICILPWTNAHHDVDVPLASLAAWAGPFACPHVTCCFTHAVPCLVVGRQ
jgi:hypothetical protein